MTSRAARSLPRAGGDPEPARGGAGGRRPRHRRAAGARARGRRGRRRLEDRLRRSGTSLPACRRRTGGGTPLFFCAHLDTVPPQGPLEPVVGRTASSGTPAGTILGADNKAAVAAMIEAARRVVEEGRPHAGIELLLHAEGGGRADRRGGVRPHALEAAARLRLRPGGADRRRDHGRAVPAHARRALPRPAGALGHGTRRRAARRSPPRRARSPTSGSAGSTTRRPRTSGTIEGGTAPNIIPEWCSFDAEARSHDERKLADLVQEMLDTFAVRREPRGVHARDRGERDYRGYRFKRDDPIVRLARTALERCGYELAPSLTGGGADANVFNERGLPCLNLANGMAEIHTPTSTSRSTTSTRWSR